MMHRNARQAKILEIIARKEIETQEELCGELNKLNFNVTQATISRDIKELKLYKVAGTLKKYKYAYIEGDGDAVSNKMRNLFRECVQSINYANNLIIIKTMRGNAGSAGTFVDSLQIQEVIGCVAGDDTIMLVVDSNENTPKIVERLREYIS
ncbi:MAG: arginine repressor [Clostridia bacterium]|nr:arginine repressor [Clostridia bacterium]